MTVRLSLGLQGGGAHGAFTWGALDRILQDEGIEIAAISGTSAGALNAAALKSGWIAGGATGARAELARVWGAIGAVTDEGLSHWLSALSPPVAIMAEALRLSPLWAAVDGSTRLLSPYAMAPMLQSPLRQMVDSLDFGRVCAGEGPDLFIGATNVRTGRIRVFSGDEIGPDAILASTCLPTLFRAVEIDDPATGMREAYWDGGYTGNPALFPLFRPDLPDDILIVSINPQRREDLPVDIRQIENRINEISFNSSLSRELRAIAFVKRLIAQGNMARGVMKDLNLHMIADDDLMTDLNVATKTIPVPAILARLRAAGYAAADRFLTRHRGDLGRRGTLDLAAML